MSYLRRRFLRLIGLTVALLVVGTAGFIQLGWNLSDAFYMTVITLTAVGYQEVRPLTEAGRIFTSVLLAGGITNMGLYFALLTSAIVEMDLADVFRKRRIMKKIEDLRDHVIVCGAGRTGRQVVRELMHADVSYVVIERDPDRAELVRELDPEVLVLEADATRDESLEDAGIDRARGLVAALSADTDNLFVTLTARHGHPHLEIVARAQQEESVAKLRRAGADHVVSPNVTGGVRMASVLLRPTVMSFLDVVTGAEGLSLRIEEVPVEEGSPLAGTTLEDARIPQRTGLIVIAVKHEGSVRDREFIYNPGPEERIEEGDVLIVLGRPEQVAPLRSLVRA